MNISELEAQLKVLRENHGDLPVYSDYSSFNHVAGWPIDKVEHAPNIYCNMSDDGTYVEGVQIA